MADITPLSGPVPAPEIVMDATGNYWRRYEGSLSMVPTSDDNDPLLPPLAVYRLVGWEDPDRAGEGVGADG